jgi:NADPH:quinone reductase-like Zn-dependent oxidoreductase
MKAIRFHAYGDADVLRYEEAARPEPAAGEVLVEVAATSFNPIDAGIRAGYLQEIFPISLPHVPGIDVAGRVAALGAGVTRWKVGDEVIGVVFMVRDGAAAEFVTVSADALAPAPTTIPLENAAALPAVGLTAWQAVFEHAGIQSAQRRRGPRAGRRPDRRLHGDQPGRGDHRARRRGPQPGVRD